MKFVELTGAQLLDLATEDEGPDLRVAGVTVDTRIRINPQGDIEMFRKGNWNIIGGLLGDYKNRIQRLTGKDWT